MKVIQVHQDFFKSMDIVSTFLFTKKNFENLSDKNKYELALLDIDNFSIWDDIKSFETDLNDKIINLTNCYIYFLNI